jgi:hypothetical protein
MIARKTLLLTLLTGLVTMTFLAAQTTGSGPKIAITGIPHAGQGGPGPTEEISGTASGPDLRELRIVIYAFAGDQWWVQPTAANPMTSIDVSSGKWETDTHLGRNYAALLVRKSYKAPATADSVPAVGGDVLATDTVAGKH